MTRTVVLSCLIGHGISLLPLLLFFGIAAVPTPSTKPPSTEVPLLDVTTGSTSSLTTAAIATSEATPSSNISSTSSAPTENLPQDTDPPAIVNNENVTETEIVITEARHGKSLHHHHNQQDLIAKNESHINVITTEKSAPSASSEFTVKLATSGDHEVQHLGEDGDAPPQVDGTEDPDAKPQELVEPRLLFVPAEPTVSTERDKMIQKIFGGECDFAHWNRCSRIEFWGGDYLVPDKHNPGKFLVRHHKIRCAESPKHTICLRNGWTVERCHMLCMSQCNVDYRMNYEKLVSHEGDCKIPILRK